MFAHRRSSSSIQRAIFAASITALSLKPVSCMWWRSPVEFFFPLFDLFHFFTCQQSHRFRIILSRQCHSSGICCQRPLRTPFGPFHRLEMTTSHDVFILCQLRLCSTRLLHHTLSVDPALRWTSAVFPVELDANFCHFKSNHASPPDVVNGFGDLFWAVNLCLCQSLWGGRVATRSVISLL